MNRAQRARMLGRMAPRTGLPAIIPVSPRTDITSPTSRLRAGGVAKPGETATSPEFGVFDTEHDVLVSRRDVRVTIQHTSRGINTGREFRETIRTSHTVFGGPSTPDGRSDGASHRGPLGSPGRAPTIDRGSPTRYSTKKSLPPDEWRSTVPGRTEQIPPSRQRFSIVASY